MKPNSIHRFGGLCAALFLAASATATRAQVAVDGWLEEYDGYTVNALQSTPSSWGDDKYLAKVATVQDGGDLAVFLAGRPADNAFILFIDTKAGGPSTISNNQITSGGDHETINNLGPAGDDTGMTFEDGFNPDYAVRVYGNGTGTEAHVNFYNLQTGVRGYFGQIVAANNPPNGFVTEARAIWSNLAAPYDPAEYGAELKLSLAGLGVPTGTGVPIKLMAVLVNGDSTYGSNQVLGSRTTPTADIGGDINNINFETVEGVQTLTITVDNVDTDGDGIPDDIDDDDDNDGLPDIHETNDGNYVSITQTGTDPKIADTDSDGLLDGEEADGSALGYISNPNIPNYNSMAVPGSFTTPDWQPDGSAGNAMIQGNTASLTEQYVWTLNYKFNTTGAIEYKYAANGTWTASWGNGGNNHAATIQAAGFHTFTFNNATLAQSLARTVFPDVTAFLTAYGLEGDPTGDADGDNVSNEDEFVANTDPTNADSDGDGVNDDTDPDPLLATRDVVFTVNMTVQEANGNFNPDTGAVVVKFFTGLLAGIPDLTLDEIGDTGIYTGTLPNLIGPTGAESGGYKFFNTTPGAPNSGYEDGDNRTFPLGAANTPQTLATVFFSNDGTVPGDGYGAWATANAGGQTADLDFDGDGVPNGVEFFMGETGSSFTANPGVVANVVSWPKSDTYTGAYGVDYVVQTSGNLTGWTDVLITDPNLSDGDPLQYTLPAGSGPLFVRLKVIAP